MIEELKNKENLLKVEQEEKKLLQEKLESLQGGFLKGADADNNKEL